MQLRFVNILTLRKITWYVIYENIRIFKFASNNLKIKKRKIRKNTYCKNLQILKHFEIYQNIRILGFHQTLKFEKNTSFQVKISLIFS